MSFARVFYFVYFNRDFFVIGHRAVKLVSKWIKNWKRRKKERIVIIINTAENLGRFYTLTVTSAINLAFSRPTRCMYRRSAAFYFVPFCAPRFPSAHFARQPLCPLLITRPLLNFVCVSWQKRADMAYEIWWQSCRDAVKQLTLMIYRGRKRGAYRYTAF